ncbi:MAG: hypothetical protein OEZ01_06475 [Candidatus Heimdallarchaeota archaeon]|nr:hypothetical protein [Candidatus Heimdallarchaeota archaeon]
MTDLWKYHPEIREGESISYWVKRIADQYEDYLSYFLKQSTLRKFNYNGLDIDPDHEILEFLSTNTGVSLKKFQNHGLITYNDKFQKIRGIRKEWR